MKKRFLALLLALLMLGSPLAYADDAAAETAEAPAEVEDAGVPAAAEVAAAPAAVEVVEAPAAVEAAEAPAAAAVTEAVETPAAAPAAAETAEASETSDVQLVVLAISETSEPLAEAEENTASDAGSGTEEAAAQEPAAAAEQPSDAEKASAAEKTVAEETTAAVEAPASYVESSPAAASVQSPAASDGDSSESASAEVLTITITKVSDVEESSEEPAAEEKTAPDAETSEDTETPEDAESEETEESLSDSKELTSDLLEGSIVKPTTDVNPDKYAGNKTLISSQALAEPFNVDGITVSSLELGDMPTNGHQYLKFTFCNEGDNTIYEGYLAGIKVYSVEDTKTDIEKLVNLAASIADKYYKNETISLSDKKDFAEKYGLVINSIDAEKIYSDEYMAKDESIDENLCWAASASNMIEFAGWNDKADASLNLSDEDAVFDYFTQSFTDDGSQQAHGIKWFMNGTNPEQDTLDGEVLYYSCTKVDGVYRYNCYHSDGTLKWYHDTETVNSSTFEAYRDSEGNLLFYYQDVKENNSTIRSYYDKDDNFVFKCDSGNYYDADGNQIASPGLAYGISSEGSQKKIESLTTAKGNAAGKNGNVTPDYAAENVSKLRFIEGTSDYEGLYNSVMGLKNEVATGLGICFYVNGQEDGGHAVTLFGYIKDSMKEGWESLKAMFLTDSDSSDSKDKSLTRAGALDSLDMYELKTERMDTGAGEQETLFLENYYAPELKIQVPILGYSVLQPASTAEEAETEGSKNAVTSVDYRVKTMSAGDSMGEYLDTIDSGDEIFLYTSLENRSYVDLSSYQDPYFVLIYTMDFTGEEKQDLEVKVPLNLTEKNAGDPFSVTLARTGVTLEGDGYCTITVRLAGIYYTDADGNPVKIQEAYTSNNACEESFIVMINGAEQPEETEAPQAESITIPVFSVSVDGSGQGDCVIELTGIKAEIYQVKLNDQILTADDYTITYAADGTPTIIFSEAFLHTLRPGVYIFRILGASGNLLACIRITIR